MHSDSSFRIFANQCLPSSLDKAKAERAKTEPARCVLSRAMCGFFELGVTNPNPKMLFMQLYISVICQLGW